MNEIKSLEQDIENKNKKIKELYKEKINTEKRATEECNAIRDENDILKEKLV